MGITWVCWLKCGEAPGQVRGITGNSGYSKMWSKWNTGMGNSAGIHSFNSWKLSSTIPYPINAFCLLSSEVKDEVWFYSGY